MDKEKQSADKKIRACSALHVFMVAVLMLCLVFSTVAMIMAFLTFHKYQSSHTILDEENFKTTDTFDDELDTKILAEMEKELELSGEMHFSHETAVQEEPRERRETESERQKIFNDLCNSTLNKNYNESKPIAHITPPPSLAKKSPIAPDLSYHSKEYVDLTTNWICNSTSKKERHGLIFGGMVFDRPSGNLIVPLDGIYYIYSHVEFNILGSDKVWEASARVAACLPEIGCSYLTSTTSVSHYTHRRLVSEKGDSGVYQAGLFHLPANSRIRLMVNDPKKGRSYREQRGPDFLFTSSVSESSYMGAYMVQELPFSI